MQSTLTSKGQLTLPKAIREQLRLHPGDKLEFFLRDDGRLEMVLKGSDITALKGMIPPPRKNVSQEEITQAIAEGASAG